MHHVEHGRFGWYIYRGRVYVAGPFWSKRNAEQVARDLDAVHHSR